MATIAFVGDTLLGGQFTEPLRARGYASALEGIEPPGAVTALELHLIDVDNRGNACRPTLVRDGVGVSFLRALTTAQDGWREHGHALRLELPVHCPRG